jgi:hypothetical protein
MSTALPRWVWDLIADLEDQEDIHPRLLVNAAGGPVPYDWCPAASLAHVPADVRAQARVIADYRRKAQPGDEGAAQDGGGA